MGAYGWSWAETLGPRGERKQWVMEESESGDSGSCPGSITNCICDIGPVISLIHGFNFFICEKEGLR